jgi:hypothetical protein
MTRPSAVVGWDIGGVNTKGARLERAKGRLAIHSVCLPHEMQRHPEGLSRALLDTAGQLGVAPHDLHAVTMTAELSQAFRTKREGVGYVLDALETTFPGASLQVYTVEGRFVNPPEARTRPFAVGAANWAATANLVAHAVPTSILIDIGTTSTDLIPIVNGKVVACGSTDPERLLSGELVYTGALRTPVEAVAPRVPLWGENAGVAAEGFALMGDAHLWLGRLRPEDYTCRTPDGRPPTREFAGERLARAVCADREMLGDSDIDALAAALADAQVRLVIESLQRIRRRWPEITSAVVAGLGDFIAVEAAGTAGLSVVCLADHLGSAARTAPAAAVAWLLWRNMESDR